MSTEVKRTVRLDIDDAICTITIDRPEVRNAVDGPTALQLRDAFEEFEGNDDLAVAVLTGRLAAVMRKLSVPSAVYPAMNTVPAGAFESVKSANFIVGRELRWMPEK